MVSLFYTNTIFMIFIQKNIILFNHDSHLYKKATKIYKSIKWNCMNQTRPYNTQDQTFI